MERLQLKPRLTGTLHLNFKPKLLEPVQPAPEHAYAVSMLTKSKKYLSDARVSQRISDLAMLRDAYPILFDAAKPLPLAIGIHNQIAEILGSKRRAHTLLHWYCSQKHYKRSVEQSDVRYDLNLTALPKEQSK